MAFERREGFTGSIRLIHSNFWPAVGRIGLLFLITYAISSVVYGGMYFLFLIVSAVVQVDHSRALAVVILVVTSVLLLLVALAVSVLSQVVMQSGYLVTYAELRGRFQPDLTTAQLAAEVNA
jgi:hypothetical protein